MNIHNARLRFTTWYNLTMKTNTKTTKIPRVYRKITKAEIAAHEAAVALTGNGSAAQRYINPSILAPSARAFKIVRKSKTVDTSQFIDDQLQQIGVDAVNRLGKLINSPNEAVATKNVHYAIDHIRGQATKKSIALTGKINIQDIIA